MRFGGTGTGFGEVVERFGVLSVSMCAVVRMARGARREARRVPARGRGVCRVTGGVPADTSRVFGDLGRE